MVLKSLSLVQYKNFETADFQFDEKINCIVGKNGRGKTNILDSIYHLAYTKSYFNPITSQNVLHGKDFFVIDGRFNKNEKIENVLVSYKKGQKKVVKRNAKVYEKLKDHVGFVSVVIVSPTDRDLIMEGSDVRRKFIDGIISQIDQNYLNNLIKYNAIIAQRNALLKYFAANRTFESATLDIYDEQLNGLASQIFEVRKTFIDLFSGILKSRYQDICQKEEHISVNYKSHQYRGSLKSQLKDCLQKDMALQYTSVGIHKDDLVFNIEGYPIKKFGSQGQQKSYLIALKFAQYDYLKKEKGIKPIMLLDDIFDKLDESRVNHIISMITREDIGQLFISDTHIDRTENVVKQNANQYKIINLDTYN
jgi:DNA replication and repair protein RecF